MVEPLTANTLQDIRTLVTGLGLVKTTNSRITNEADVGFSMPPSLHLLLICNLKDLMSSWLQHCLASVSLLPHFNISVEGND